MTDRFLLDHDASTGVTEYFHVIEDGQWAIETTQDVSGLVEVARAAQNENTGRWGEMALVAIIPPVIQMQLIQQGILSGTLQVQDPARFRAWLNDPDNRAFRFKLGRV